MTKKQLIVLRDSTYVGPPIPGLPSVLQETEQVLYRVCEASGWTSHLCVKRIQAVLACHSLKAAGNVCHVEVSNDGGRTWSRDAVKGA